VQAEGEDKRSLSPSTVDTHQVTDVGSQTTVGCFSRRNTKITLLATIEEELTKAVLTEAKKERNGTGQEQHREITDGTEWKEGPA
jgi:hypothetical protein